MKHVLFLLLFLSLLTTHFSRSAHAREIPPRVITSLVAKDDFSERQNLGDAEDNTNPDQNEEEDEDDDVNELNQQSSIRFTALTQSLYQLQISVFEEHHLEILTPPPRF